MTTMSNKLNVEIKDDARLTFDERLRTGTRRVGPLRQAMKPVSAFSGAKAIILPKTDCLRREKNQNNP